MLDTTPIVFVVDDDASVRESVEDLTQRAGLRSELFASAREFLRHPRTAAPCCLVLEAQLPDLTGLELQSRVAAERNEMPVIFITSCEEVPTIVRAMKAGALEFLAKPFDAAELLRAVHDAIERSRTTLVREAGLRALRERHGSLTVREQQVMALVVSGHLNKQAGGELGISEITVKAHRGRVMRKMQAGSLAHLIDMAGRLGLTPNPRGNAASGSRRGDAARFSGRGLAAQPLSASPA
jgi:FixJ family two-component response regulator